jgi:hypothetical protein
MNAPATTVEQDRPADEGEVAPGKKRMPDEKETMPGSKKVRAIRQT